MDGSFQPSHPGSLAHLDPPPLTASIAADLICAGLNNNLLAEELSPSLSRLERQLCGWFSSRLGLPASAGGVAASGGSLSNLNALVVARQAVGLAQNPDAVVFASIDAHGSLAKAVRVLGLRDDALQAIPVDDNGRLRLDGLEERLQACASSTARVWQWWPPLAQRCAAPSIPCKLSLIFVLVSNFGFMWMLQSGASLHWLRPQRPV